MIYEINLITWQDQFSTKSQARESRVYDVGQN